MIAYSCFVLFLAYKNCRFKAGGVNDNVDALALLQRDVTSSACARQHVFWSYR